MNKYNLKIKETIRLEDENSKQVKFRKKMEKKLEEYEVKFREIKKMKMME